MPPLLIIAHLDVLKHGGARLVAGAPVRVVHQFPLGRREEAPGDRVVPTVPHPAHAAGHPVRHEQRPVVGGRIARRGCPQGDK